MPVKLLKYSSLALCLYMVYLVIITSMQSNLLEAIPRLNKEPWFNTTIVDFYFNIAILSAWVLYKESKILKSILWIIAFICLGSIATLLYVFLKLNALKDNEPISKVLLKENV